MYMAPSFAGATESSRVTFSTRSQWFGVSGRGAVYTTYLAAFDHYLQHFNSGIGGVFVQDRAGSANFGMTEGTLLYSYNFRIFHTWYVRPGVSFTYGEYGLDNSEIKYSLDVIPDYSNEIDHQEIDKLRYFDANASVLVYTNKLWFGATAAHLLSPDMESDNFVSDKSTGITLFGGGEIIKKSRLLNPVDETLNLAGQVRWYNTQKQFDIGLYWYKHPLILGAWYRGIPVVNSHRGDAVIVLIGVKNSWFYLGYSYDFTISNLLSSSQGSHEISFNIKFTTPERKEKRGAVPCPHF